MRATQQERDHSRPQMIREAWQTLDGPWGFTYDDDDRGLDEGWHRPDARPTRALTLRRGGPPRHRLGER